MAAPTVPEDESCGSTLLIRHLPATLSDEDKTSLLKHFGATHVRVMGTQGRMKHCAFAVFPNHAMAEKALHRLHQIDIDDCCLRVEYSRKQLQKYHPKSSEEYGLMHQSSKPEKTTEPEKRVPVQQKVAKEIDSMASHFQVEYPINPNLRYRYPPPSVSILTNIANTLASVPKFYVQVLHLMNKMNLPAPFGSLTATPPLPEDLPQPPVPAEPDVVEEQAMEVSSSEESEIESDGEKPKPETPVPKVGKKRKAKAVNITIDFKRQKILEEMALQKTPGPIQKPAEVFEQPQSRVKKGLELKIPTTVAISDSSKTDNGDIFKTEPFNPLSSVIKRYQDIVDKFKGDDSVGGGKVIEDILNVMEEHHGSDDEDTAKLQQTILLLLQKYQVTVPPSQTVVTDIESVLREHSEKTQTGGFGKMEPVTKEDTKEEDSEEEIEEWGSGKFISSRRLRKGRISRSEMKSLSVFKNYSPGDVTARLYVKNIQAKTTEQDLHYVYGRYVDWDNEMEKSMFDIRLMKEGRMKGQAFITLGSETRAKEAVEETNGFDLNGKPLVVQFARSAKPNDAKEGEGKETKGK